MQKESRSDGPHEIDRCVGLRIRLRRMELGVSQGKLAQALGITFQQVQKYERAANRISASKLYELAHVLKVPPSYFFEGLDERPKLPTESAALLAQADFLMTAEGRELAQLFPRAPARVRRTVLDLVRAVAGIDAEPDPRGSRR